MAISKPAPGKSTVRLSESDLNLIVKKVLESGELRGILAARAGDSGSIAKTVLKKLAPLTMKKGQTFTSWDAEIKKLQGQIARAGVLEAVPLRQKLARLEARSGK